MIALRSFISSSRGSARAGLVLAAIAVGALGCVGVAANRMWPRHKPGLVVVGDSVTFLSIGAIEDRLGGSYDLDIRAYPGQRSTELALVLMEEVGERADRGEQIDHVALLVGYNDVLRHTEHPEDVVDLVATASEGTCAVALAVPAPPTWSDQDDIEQLRASFAAYNERLTAEVDRYDNVHLWTGWQEAVEGSAQGELVDTDGVHPVEAGYERLAREYEAALDQHC